MRAGRLAKICFKRIQKQKNRRCRDFIFPVAIFLIYFEKVRFIFFLEPQAGPSKLKMSFLILTVQGSKKRGNTSPILVFEHLSSFLDL